MLDIRKVYCNKSLNCSKQLSITRNSTFLSDLNKTPSLDINDLKQDTYISLLVGYFLYKDLFKVLPNHQIIDSLIRKYFILISIVNLA